MDVGLSAAMRDVDPADRSLPLPQIWRIRRVERDAGDKCERPVEIGHLLRAGEGALTTTESVAGLQSGLVHHRQLRALGLGRDAIARRVRSGRLVVVFPSVFAIGGHPLDEVARCFAALLHVGANGVLSHGTAAAIWGFVDVPPVVRATVIVRHVRDDPGLRVHRVSALDARDVRLVGRLPLTAPARTLLDLAARASDSALEEALARARARELVIERDLEEALERAPLRRGARRLRRLRRQSVGRAVTFSRFERDLIRLLEAAGLPIPRFNAVVNGHRVDAVWQGQRIVVECDGWAFHRERRSFERDRRRDQDHLAAGYRTVRITWRQLHDEPARIAALLASLLTDPAP